MGNVVEETTNFRTAYMQYIGSLVTLLWENRVVKLSMVKIVRAI